MRTLLYCQHSLGIGHLVRTLLLAEALAECGPVAVLCGGPVPGSLAVDPRLVLIRLPPLSMNLDGTLDENAAGGAVEHVLAARAREAVGAVTAFAPDVVIVEMFPFGRKKFAAEIIAAIEAARVRGGVRVLSSVRDVLVTKRKDQEWHDERAARWLNQYFDAVIVHSDPTLVRLEETFSAHAALRVPLRYTGYVARAARAGRPSGTPAGCVVVSAGGGRVGAALMRAAGAAAPEIHAATGLRTVLLGGSLDSSPSTSGVAPECVEALPPVPDLRALLAESAVSVSQCGYNTATDVLGAGVPAVVVPFEAPREDEQLRRAEILARRGRVTLLRERELSPGALAAAVVAVPRVHSGRTVDLDGAAATRRIVTEVAGHG
jgi:predicted glycosyltransferase